MVTTSLSARFLIRRQLQTLTEVDWTVVTGDAYDDAPPGLKVDVLPLRREFSPADLPAFFRLWRYFRRQRFDLVQTHTPKASFLGLPAIRLSGTPTIYTVHGSMYFKGNGKAANVLGWLFERWCCSWAERVLVQSREDADTLPRARICPARKLSYQGNGIDLARFVRPLPSVPSVPVGGGDEPVVLMVSRLVTEKGCRDFFEVARALSGQARFVHVGMTEHDQRDAISQAEIDEISRSGIVSFVGSVNDVAPHLAAADVVVLPSYREGIPRAAMEAAATGRPVAAYDIRGVREVIDPTTGLLARRGDVAQLTEIVRGLITDAARRVELGRACQSRVVEMFSEDAVIDRLREVYRSLEVRVRPGDLPPAS